MLARVARGATWRMAAGRRAWRAALWPVRQPERKFVIFGNGRSGTELLVQLLDSQPGVRCDGEILNQRVPSPKLHVLSHAVDARRDGATTYGFKLLLYQIGQAQHLKPQEFTPWLEERGFTFVLLRREDVLRSAVSGLAARRPGVRYHYQGEAPELEPLVVEPEQLVAMMVERERRNEMVGALVADRRHVALSYEDDLLDPACHQAAVERVAALVGFEPGPVQSTVARNPARPLAQIIANYDEVEPVVRLTRFARFLDQ